MSEVEEDIISIGDIEDRIFLKAERWMGILFLQQFYTFPLCQYGFIFQIIRDQLLRDVILFDTDRIELFILSVTGPFVDEELHLWTLLLIFLIEMIDLYDLFLILFVDKALPSRDDPSLYQQVCGLQDFPVSAFSACIEVLYIPGTKERQLDFLHACLLQERNIVLIPDDTPETGQFKTFRYRILRDSDISLPSFFIVIAIVRFPEPAVEGDLFEIRRKEVHDHLIRPLFHISVGHMS